MTASLVSVLATLKGPHINFAGLSPLIALLAGAVIVLVAGLFFGPGGGRKAASVGEGLSADGEATHSDERGGMRAALRSWCRGSR